MRRRRPHEREKSRHWRLERLSSGYGASVVLRGVSLDVAAGEAVALLGKNGMGKSTLLKTVMGYLPKKGGQVRLNGQDITRQPPHRIARQGIAYAAQEHALFADLSIRDNLRLGLAKESVFDERFAGHRAAVPGLQGPAEAGCRHAVRRRAEDAAAGARPDDAARGDPAGRDHRRAAALGDRPAGPRAAGRERARDGTTMLIVEQNVPFALQVADRYVVLKQGELVDEGDAPRRAGPPASVFEHLRV
jgi:ABC-type branched-subunit amino acid transport system ATPase component